MSANDKGVVQPGARVRVTKSITVYHVPKAKEGMDLQGLDGEVVTDVREYKGLELSSNLPWKVRFELEGKEGAKPRKFFAHLVS